MFSSIVDTRKRRVYGSPGGDDDDDDCRPCRTLGPFGCAWLHSFSLSYMRMCIGVFPVFSHKQHALSLSLFTLFCASCILESVSLSTSTTGFASVVQWLQGCHNILILTGAGVSVSCGIPDFRSAGSGLYETLQCSDYDHVTCPEDLFDYEFFQQYPQPFYQFAQRYQLYQPCFTATTAVNPPATITDTTNNSTVHTDGTKESLPDIGSTTTTTTMTNNNNNHTTDTVTTTTTPSTTTVPTTATAHPPRVVVPSRSHQFLGELQQRGQLLRVYSQNMDSLEERAGVASHKIVYAHGSLQWAQCLSCNHKVAAQELQAEILAGQVAYCKQPIKSRRRRQGQGARPPVLSSSSPPPRMSRTGSNTSSSTTTSTTTSTSGSDTPIQPINIPQTATSPSPRLRRTRKRPRESQTDDDDDGEEKKADGTPDNTNNNNSTLRVEPNRCGGLMKPGITFFGQPLQDQVGRCLQTDYHKVDALIVMGTSLSVAPISKVVSYLPAHIPRILINRTLVHPPSPTTNCAKEDPLPKQPRKTSMSNQTKTTAPDKKSPSEGTDANHDFRKDYVFDAYLLGFCDDVTRALGKHVFASDNAGDVVDDDDDGNDPATSNRSCTEGELLATVLKQTPSVDKGQHKNDDPAQEEEGVHSYSRDDWSVITVPPERVFLFPGAQPPPPANGTSTNSPS